ncbi:MAG: dephospho-CoA kinase [Eubacteriaceae bacterium]
MKIFGLTGGIASGKSTVSTILSDELNIKVIDADILARKVVEVNSIALKKIVIEFGIEVLKDNESLDRKKLRDIVFKDKNKIKLLNDIVHPEVDKLYKGLINKYKEECQEYVIYDCPLLIEENLINRVDKIILVVADESLQMQRLISRDNLSKEQAKKIIDIQMKSYQKLKVSHYIIFNDGNYEDLKSGVNSLWDTILEQHSNCTKK